MDSQAIRVLFLTRYPVAGASSRYRVFQYLPYLQAEGVHGDVKSFMNEDFYRLTFRPGRTFAKAWYTLLATLARTWAVARAGRYDVIYMQRELLPFGPPLLERWLKHRGLPIVFDYDDALFIAKPSRYNPMATLFRAPDKIKALFGLADLVLAGNDWLRDQARAFGGRAKTFEVAEDVGRYLPPPALRRPEVVTIGWLGSTSTVKYLRLIEPVLRDIAEEFPQARFELMGGGEFEMPGVPWRVEPWSLDGEVQALARYDIGLMPLPEEDWAKGKSGGKARTYMAAAVVPVCSAIGYNLELVDQARTGFLCSDAESWRDTLRTLIRKPELRQRVGTQARIEVEQRFSPAKQARKMASYLHELASAGRHIG